MVEYDSNGRMKYNPELHTKQGQPWNLEDQQYLIDWYNVAGIEEVSLALERSELCVAERVSTLKRWGLMPKIRKKNQPRLLLEGRKKNCLGDYYLKA